MDAIVELPTRRPRGRPSVDQKYGVAGTRQIGIRLPGEMYAELFQVAERDFMNVSELF